MLDKPTVPTEAAPEESAGIGHNNPPAFDAEALAAHKATVAEFMSVTQQWLSLEAIKDDNQAEQLTDQITGLRGLWKKVDDARKAEKKPHDDAGAAVQAAFNPILEKLKKAADALKPKLAAYVTAKAEREAAEKAAAAAAARKAAEEAEAASRAAEESGDIAAQVEADEAKKAAEAQAKIAAKAPTSSVKSASGAGRTMAMRTIKDAEITNINILFMHFRNHPDVAEVLQRLANNAVRAKDYDHDAAPIPGIDVKTRQAIA